MARRDGFRPPAWVTLALGIACVITPVAAQKATGEGSSQLTEQAVTFPVGSVTLSGTLLRLPGRGSQPAIVLLHGSGPGPQQQLRAFADRFARLGFATLVFDKRGSGASGGSWTEESLDDLADDALAAVSFLKAQPGVDSQRVGVWGISQAGWVIPRAAARVPSAFAFAIVVTGGGVRPLEIEQHDYAVALDRAGVKDGERRMADALVELYFAYLKTGENRGGLEQAIQAAHDKPWFEVVDFSRILPAESTRNKWEWVTNYDPASDIQHMTMPVLVVLGGRDRPELFTNMNDRWRSNLAFGHNSDSTVVEFLNAEHGAAVVGTHHVIYSGGPPTFVPGYLDMVDAWLLAHNSLKDH
jgi:pimeloyl-ACP methyl ester carboxylesterase